VRREWGKTRQLRNNVGPKGTGNVAREKHIRLETMKKRKRRGVEGEPLNRVNQRKGEVVAIHEKKMKFTITLWNDDGKSWVVHGKGDGREKKSSIPESMGGRTGERDGVA